MPAPRPHFVSMTQDFRTDMVTVKVECPFCGQQSTTQPLDIYELSRWINGEMIQNALPLLDDDQRELLMTGIDNDCFPKEPLQATQIEMDALPASSNWDL